MKKFKIMEVQVAFEEFQHCLQTSIKKVILGLVGTITGSFSNDTNSPWNAITVNWA